MPDRPRGRRGRRISALATTRYPRSARVGEVVREVVAEELTRLSDIDERLRLVTVTGVKVDPDLRHATVWLSSMSEATASALAEDRVRLQTAIGRQVRLKRTPQLAFAADPAVAAGARVEEILRTLEATHDEDREDGPDHD